MSSGLLVFGWRDLQFTNQLAQELARIVCFMIFLRFELGDQCSHAIELLRQADHSSGRLRKFRSAGSQLALSFRDLVFEAENAGDDRMLGVLAVSQALLLTKRRGNQGAADFASKLFEAAFGRFCSGQYRIRFSGWMFGDPLLSHAVGTARLALGRAAE